MRVDPYGSASLPTPGGAVNGVARLTSASVPAEASRNRQSQSSIDPAQLEKALGKISESLGPHALSIQFIPDTDSGKTIVKVIDKQTQELIRQIPSEEVLAIAKSLDRLQGMLMRQKA